MLQLLLLFPGQSLVWYVEYQWVGQVKPPEVYPEIKVGSKGWRNQKTHPSTLLYSEEFFSNPADTSNSWVNGSFKTWGLHLLTTYTACMNGEPENLETNSCICPPPFFSALVSPLTFIILELYQKLSITYTLCSKESGIIQYFLYFYIFQK